MHASANRPSAFAPRASFPGALLGALLLAATGCGPSPEYEAEMETLRAKVKDLEAANQGLEKENTDLNGQARQLKAEMERMKARETWSRLGIAEGGALSATLKTTKGEIHCELWPQYAPQTVLNFVELAEGTREWTDPSNGEKVRRPLYDGTIFHRVIPTFMIQGGDPLGTGTGGPGYEFADEVSSGRSFNEPGLLAMANSGPNTNGSQFFITDRATPSHLDGKHTIFGKCGNLDVVQAIAEAETGPRDRPVTDIVLQKVSIQR